MSSKYIDNNTYATSGYTLSGVFQSITIGPAGTIGGPGIMCGTKEAYTLVNRGRVSGTANGIRLQDGGSITNSGGAELSGGNGVVVIAGIATVGNAGAIAATANGSAHNGTVSNSFGVLLGGGGAVTNTSSGIIRATGSYGVAIDIAGLGSVSNAGTIQATGTRRYYLASGGIFLSGGGSVTNAAGALIESPLYGIFVKKAPGSIVNSGTIDCPGTSGIAVDFFRAAGVLNNLGAGALIEGSVGVSAFEAGAIINNTGTILSNAYGGDAINMDNYGGGTIVNGTHGLIGAIGRYGAAIFTTGQGASVENAGVIDNAIELFGGGTVVNSAGGVIAGAISLSSGNVINAGTIETTVVQNGANGIECTNLNNETGGLITTTTGINVGYGSVSNAGTIENIGTDGLAIMLDQGQSVTNSTGALIEGFDGINLGLSYATIINSGTVLGSGGRSLSSGYFGYGVKVGELGGAIVNTDGGLIVGAIAAFEIDGTLTNSGTIEGIGTYGVAAICANAGVVLNLAGGLISGYQSGTDVRGSALTNSGTIAASGTDGDGALVSGVLTNDARALIKGHYGVEVYGTATLTNAGSIIGVGSYSVGVDLSGATALKIVNDAAGQIFGITGLYARTAGIVVNSGTIGSNRGALGTAIVFTSSSDVLVEASSARIIGSVIGAGGTLELSGTHGTLTGLGTSFSGFGTVDVLAGASWTFTGADAVASSLHDSGSLTLDGAVTVAGALSGAGTLILADDETFASGTHLTVSDVSLVGGSATLRTNLAYAGAFGESGGVAVVSGETLALTGAASFAGGAVAGDGFLETHGTVSLAALEVAGDAVWRDFGTVSESGTLTLGGAGGGSGRLTTEAGALFDITGNGGIEVTAGGSGMIINTGLLEKTSGTGTSILVPAIDNTGTLKAQVGTLELAGAVTGTGTLRIGIGGTLRLDAAVASTETVTFSSTAGTLILHDPSGGGLGFSGLITSFGSADRLDLATFAYSGKPKVSWIQSGGKGTLTVTDGKDVAKITLFGQYAAAGFKPANDGGGGTVVTYTAPTGQAALANPHV